ncbi:MAG: hypothetical protein H6741_30020 [Alphaproteobacteria bacterium]|nr:hypothetical protein [Alphaproteobacteria bacterium]
MRPLAEIKAEVRRFIEAPGALEPAALALFRWQREAIPAYGRFAGEVDPIEITEIPAVPVELFKELRFCATETPGALFRTSGTTSGRRGEHAMPDAELYELAARRWFEALLPDCPTGHTLSLCTNPVQHPDSSLGHMVALFAPEARWFFDASSGVDTTAAWQALAAATEPIFLPTTAFALAELLGAQGEARLPPGSVMMVTGGFKGRATELDQGELVERARLRLGGEVRVVGEYGMTELSSQLWDLGEGFLPPPWLHVYAVDPVSGRPVQGEGLLRFVDLANWGSCLAIETRDLGEVVAGRVHLRGRLSEAEARGCSLTVEEAWAARGRA